MAGAVADATGPPALRDVRIALAGNPNCGKTSLFNALTGARQHVANYPGVTVERRTGLCELVDVTAEVVDLPGTYSLSSYSPEERIAEAEMMARPDVVVVVADSTQLERGLVLLAQVMQTGANPVLCLNMADEARAAGQSIDLPQMERLLGFPVVETEGHRGTGVPELCAAVARAAARPGSRHKLVLGEELDRALSAIRTALPDGARAEPGAAWTAVRLLLGDPEHVERIEALAGGTAAVAEAGRQRRQLAAATGRDVSVFVTERYFGFVDGLLREVRAQRPRVDSRQLTDRIDAVVVNRWLGLPIFALAMYAIFWLTFAVGELPMAWIEAAVGWAGRTVGSLWPAGSGSLLRSLVVDGVIGGVGGVLVFLPNILLLFLGLAFLEDAGYMARAAFLIDHVMHRFGLHGKSFIPMCMGFGCNVPAILGARIIESQKARLLTMFLTPFVPCTARLAVLTFITAAVFATHATAVVWSLVALNILILGAVGMAARAFCLKEESLPFIMELPLYHRPDPRTITHAIRTRIVSFIRRAGTVILTVSVLVWLLSYFPDGRTETSILAWIGRILEPIGRPLGLDWKMMTALLTSLVAKENAVATLGVLYGVGEQGLLQALPSVMSRASALSFLTVAMLFIPCAATIAVMRREMADRLWFISSIVLTFVVSYLGGMAAYRIALWAGL
jgi:ferrous iron transport protein B